MNSVSATRDLRIDALRGLLLVIMAAVHVPTPLSHFFQEPAGYVSAAEGFIFIGACMAGWVYGRTYQRQGWNAMSRRSWDRAFQIYSLHLALLLPAVLIAWVLAPVLPPLANHFHGFLEHPRTSLLLIPALLHQPPLFDILPLYIVFLGITPLLLACARHSGWGKIIAISGLAWLAAQIHLESRLFGAAPNWLPACGGSFNLLAWQVLWVAGLAVGETTTRRAIFPARHRLLLTRISGAVVALGLLSRHGLWPRELFSPDLYLWMDKWTLGPLRLLNFSAWVVLLLSWSPQPPRWLAGPLALPGRHSLSVFALHVPLAIVATAAIETCSLSGAFQVVLGLLIIAALFLWAGWLEQQARRRQQPVAVRPDVDVAVPASLPVASGERWPEATAAVS